MSDPIELTLKRLERLEERIGHMHEEMLRGFAQADRRTRIDALTDGLLRARTEDVDRMTELDQRLRALEQRPST